MASAAVPSPAVPSPKFTTKRAPNSAQMMKEAAEAKKYEPFIRASATKWGLPACVICGIGSRETNWGLSPLLRPNGPGGTGDRAARKSPPHQWPMPPDGLGWGRGLMQIDYESFEFAREPNGPWTDPAGNIDKGCEVLSGNYQHFVDFFKQHTDLQGDPLRAAVAAYNAGRGGVEAALKRHVDVDSYTAPPTHDYSADVLDRAGWFQAAGW